MLDGEREWMTCMQRDHAVLESGNTYFWPLQVTHECDKSAVFVGNLAHQASAQPMIVCCAVGEIQAGYIHACENQGLDAFW